jgi:ABC-type nickel/cobalt efflux system permease component RcnA
MNQDVLKEVLYHEHISLGLLLAVLGVAFLLGALHALGPGHGKSLMAAYLMGSQGRIRDAVVLALALTLSHVLVVVVVALLALWIADFFWPERAARWFGVGSGLAICGIGIWLLVSRIKAVRAVGKGRVSWGHTEEHEEGLAPAGTAALEAEHGHPHLPHAHQSSPAVAPRHWWSTLSLGLSSGIVPCPKALVILLLAISMHRVSLGLAIVASFSVGMALVLVVLGVVLVRAAHLVQRRLEVRGTVALALLGAVVIVVLGALVTMQAVKAG